jgi:hypothetical protein
VRGGTVPGRRPGELQPPQQSKGLGEMGLQERYVRVRGGGRVVKHDSARQAGNGIHREDWVDR